MWTFIHTQSALPGLKVRRCCSPVVRAGSTGSATAGQGLPVAERHPAACGEGQQVAQVDRCVDVAFVSCRAVGALPVSFTLEFRVDLLAVGAGLAGGIEPVGQAEAAVMPRCLVFQLAPDGSHGGVGLGLGCVSLHHAPNVQVFYDKVLVPADQLGCHLVLGVFSESPNPAV